jgi:CubicO group peptidase (beta-lactamase class C family)
VKMAVPETLGLDSERLGRINRAMQGYVDQGRLSGAITIVARRGEIAHAECVGWMDLEAKEPVRLDTPYPILSMTKPVTSVALMMLYEEGLFHLFDPVSKFIPEFKDM